MKWAAKTYQFGGEWFLKKWAYQLGVSISGYSDVPTNATVIIIKSDNHSPTNSTLDMKVYFAVPAPARTEYDSFDSIIVHKKEFELNFHQANSITVSHLLLYGFRWMIFHPLKQALPDNNICDIIVDINPFYRIRDILDVHHHYIDGPCCGEDTIYHYVIWEYVKQSWGKAEERCKKIGGHLPTVSTHEEVSLLEHLVLGTRFNITRPPFLSPIRLYPYTGVFLGIKTSEVCSIRKC